MCVCLGERERRKRGSVLPHLRKSMEKSEKNQSTQRWISRRWWIWWSEEAADPLLLPHVLGCQVTHIKCSSVSACAWTVIIFSNVLHPIRSSQISHFQEYTHSHTVQVKSRLSAKVLRSRISCRFILDWLWHQHDSALYSTHSANVSLYKLLMRLLGRQLWQIRPTFCIRQIH